MEHHLKEHARCLRLNDKAPDFCAFAFYQEREIKVCLDDFKGRWLLLFFYSCNFTSLEATELAEISETYSCIRKLGAGVVAISTDSVYSHQAFVETSPRACKLPFPLVSDRNGKFSRAYGVWKYETATADRAVFIIDPQGTIKYYSVYPEEANRNIGEIIRVLHCLQYN